MIGASTGGGGAGGGTPIAGRSSAFASTAVASSSSSSGAMRSTAATSATIAAIAARSGSTTFSDTTLRASPTRTPFALLRGHRLRDGVELHGRAPAGRLVGLGLVERVRLGGVDLDRIALAVGVDVVGFTLGLAAAAPIVAVVLLGERRARHAPGRARAGDEAAGGVARRPRQHHRDLARAHVGDHQQRHDHRRGRRQRGAQVADEGGGQAAQPLAQDAARTVRREAAVRERQVQQHRGRAEQQQRAAPLARALDQAPRRGSSAPPRPASRRRSGRTRDPRARRARRRSPRRRCPSCDRRRRASTSATGRQTGRRPAARCR